MKLDSIEIRNFRRFLDFDFEFSRESLIFVSENGAGKTTLLSAIAKALGRDRNITLKDFADDSEPIEIVATLSGFDTADAAFFPGEMSFSGPPTLRIGMQAVWDASEAEATVTVGFPDKGWSAATRKQREALPLLWLPTYRDPAKLLAVANSKSILGQLISGLGLGTSIDAAKTEIEAALGTLAGDPDLQALLSAARDILASIIPSVQPDAFSLQSISTQAKDILEQFQLALANASFPLPLSRQSAGLVQLAIFSFALRLLNALPKAILLVDEPEVSLHPQAQRALLAAVRGFSNQFVIGTHSSNVLDRADLRNVVRLYRGTNGVGAARPTTLTQLDAKWLSRFFSSQTAEACFARKVVLVEGPSDRVLLLRLLERIQKNADALGVTIISLDGGSTISAYLRLFGPKGLDVELVGLCDADKETLWNSELNLNGIAVTNRTSMEAKGFFVADPDLEGGLINALGIPKAEGVIQAEGEWAAYQTYCAQPKNAGLSQFERLRKYLHRGNVRFAVPLADAIDLNAIPGPLNGIATKL